jgi:tetratricopeptide (TPR) repeat protein
VGLRRASLGVALTWALAASLTLGALAQGPGALAQESAEPDELPWQAFNREGMLAAAAADWPTAEAAFRAALEALADEGSAGLPALDKVDDDDGRVAAVAGNLAVVLLQQDETEEARRLFERALAIRRSVFGARDPAIADSLNNLAELERRTGRLERARTLHEAALRLRREVLDEGHPDIAESLNNLGVLLRDLGDIEAAAAHLGEAHGIRRERLGPTHQATLESTGNLAAVALDMGDVATADSVLLAAIEALPVPAAASGGSPAFVLRLGIDVLLLEGDADRAVLLCEERVVEPLAATGNDGAEADRGPDPAVAELVLAELIAACARAFAETGGEVRATALLEQHLERLAAAGEAPPAVEAELRWGLAETAVVAGDLEVAEAKLGQVVSLLEAAEDARLATALNNLGSIRFERGRPLEASADLETALDLLEAQEGSVDPLLFRDVLANYAVVLRALDRNTEALAVESQLIDLATDPDDIEPAAGD